MIKLVICPNCKKMRQTHRNSFNCCTNRWLTETNLAPQDSLRARNHKKKPDLQEKQPISELENTQKTEKNEGFNEGGAFKIEDPNHIQEVKNA